MDRNLTEQEYEFIKVFPRNKSYLKLDQIRRLTRNLNDEVFYGVAQNLFMIQYVNGDLKGVGLRITDEGIWAIKRYNSKNKWADRHPVLDRFRTGSITALFSLIVGTLLFLLARSCQNREEALQNKRIDNLSDSIANLQKHIKDSSLHK